MGIDLNIMSGSSSDFMSAFEEKDNEKKSKGRHKVIKPTEPTQISKETCARLSSELMRAVAAFKLCAAVPDGKNTTSSILEHLCSIAIKDHYPEVLDLLKLLEKND